MKIHTEKEFYRSGQHFAFKLASLYRNDIDKFEDLQDYYPFPIYINGRKTYDYHLYNKSFSKHCKELEQVALFGLDYLKTISHIGLMDRAIAKSTNLSVRNDHKEVCNYLQAVKLNGASTPFITSKILVNDELSLNTPFIPSEQNLYSKVFKELLPEGEKELQQFLRYQTLTKREKEIVKLITDGLSSKQVSEHLFISEHSVKTHRKNGYRKLDINTTAALVKIALLLEILD